MDKLEHYLDQVCRSVGGPRSLRQHLRQELREHLQDAAAEYRAAGLSEEEALDRALADFGGPEQVRAELEATHGHRLLPVLLDKALEWKERTLKAKWLWMTWAYLAVACVLLLEVLYIWFAITFFLPKMQKLRSDGVFDFDARSEPTASWAMSFLHGLQWTWHTLAGWLLLLLAVGWGLFEWRVRSENKPFMRLSALGTLALVLIVVVVFTSVSQEVSFYLGLPAVARLSRPFASEQIASIDKSVGALEQALAKKDWEAVQENANRASGAVDRLAGAAFGIPGLKSLEEKLTVEELRTRLKSANESLQEAQEASRVKDAERVKAALQKFHKLYGPISKAAARPEQ
jgi:hypothetical protein